MSDKPKDSTAHSFGIIRHLNSPNDAITLSGHKVFRQEKIYMPEIGRFVVCASYSDHFLYRNPTDDKGSSLLCTCGSAGVIVGYNAYKQDASPTSAGVGVVPGEMLVCLIHAQTGLHTTGGSKWA